MVDKIMLHQNHVLHLQKVRWAEVVNKKFKLIVASSRLTTATQLASLLTPNNLDYAICNYASSNNAQGIPWRLWLQEPFL